MQFRTAHPWDPRNALPQHVLAEPGRFGTLTTAYMRRGTIDPAAVPKPWMTGYDYPSYLKSEPLGRGVYRTAYTPRRTVDTLVPAYLGDDEAGYEVGGGADPIAKFGDSVSHYLMTTIFTLPKESRKPALKALFDQLDPKLYGRVTEKASKLERQGVNPRAALGRAIAASVSTGLLEEFIAAGKKRQLPPVKSFLGLGMYDSSRQLVLEGYMEAMGGIWGSIKGAVSDAGSAIKSAAGSAGSAVKSAVTAPFRAVKTAGEQVYEWGKTAVNAIGSAACSVAGNPLGQAAAGAAGAAYGGAQGAQAAAAGVGIVNGLCGSGAAVPPPPPPAPALPGWVIPAAIAGGAGILYLLVAK